MNGVPVPEIKRHIPYSVLIPLVSWIIAQSIAGIVWVTKIDYRVTSNEARAEQHERWLGRIEESLQLTIRSQAIADERQKQIAERLLYIQGRLDTVVNYLNRGAIPPPPPVGINPP